MLTSIIPKNRDFRWQLALYRNSYIDYIGDGKECKLWLGSRGKLVIVGMWLGRINTNIFLSFGGDQEIRSGV